MPHQHRSTYVVVLAAATLLAGGKVSFSQTPQVITLAEHERRLPLLRQRVEACLAQVDLCRAADIADETFPLPNGVQTHVSYLWLRNSLAALAKTQPADRPKLAGDLMTRLRSEPLASSPTSPALARTQANLVLAQVEFAKAKPSVMQQQWARFTSWLNGALFGSRTAREAGPWLLLLFEALLFGAPLTLLALWLLREVREERLRLDASKLERGHAAPLAQAWAEIAQTHARNREWRDAVHALYWQAVVSFEQRRVWSVVRDRTPREYLRLLEPGSTSRGLLSDFTVLLEQVWYDKSAATEADFDRARQLTHELASA